MTVFTYHPCLSDVHAPIAINLKCHDDATYFKDKNNTEPDAPTTNKATQSKPKVNSWDKTKSTQFIENLDKTSIRQINEKLDTFQPDDKLSQMDHVINDVCDLFINAGAKTFGTRSVNKTGNPKRRTKVRSKPWYNHMCRNKKVIFYLA